MGAKGQRTRDRILETAEALILQRGFAGTAIEDIISQAAISKGGFFYHFGGKNDLAVGLLERYREEDALLFGGLFDRARELSDDPLQQMLIFLKLLSETMANLEELHPGCLVASFTYESQQVNEQVRQLTAACIMDWRRIFKAQIERINEQYPARAEVDSTRLADMLSSIIEGGIIVSRALGNANILVDQLLEYRKHVSLLYAQP